MTITVNGESRTAESGTTLQALIETLAILDKVMAAAVNMQIVKKEQWPNYTLNDGDKIELLQFTGGG